MNKWVRGVAVILAFGVLLYGTSEVLKLNLRLTLAEFSLEARELEIVSLKEQLKDYKEKYSALQTQNKSASMPENSAQDQGERPISSVTSSHTHPTQELPPSDRIVTWRTQQVLSDVEEMFALTAEQREKLAQDLKQRLATGTTISNANVTTVLGESLGEEFADSFGEKRAQAEERELSERLHTEVIVLGRELALSEQQEQKAREALNQIEFSLRPKREEIQTVMREAMANHLGGDEAKAALTVQYDTLKQLNAELKTERDKNLFTALSPVLSDEQKNSLLAIQASK